MKHVEAFRNIVVVHSLTKFYSMPGLRLGALVGHPDTIRKLYDFKEPWTVNTIAENAARELAGCTAYEEALYSLIADERKRITDAFYPMKSMRIAGGAANFFLVQWCGKGSFDSLLVSLQCKGIVVRDCRNFDGLEGNYFRFSVRTTEENRILLDALRICDALQTGDRE
jgi:threonine-phosphate decarboxylase